MFVVGIESCVVVSFARAWPSTIRGWLALLVLGPPAYLFLEYLGGKILSPKLGYAVSKSKFSVARIALLLFFELCIIGLALLLSYALGFSFDPG